MQEPPVAVNAGSKAVCPNCDTEFDYAAQYLLPAYGNQSDTLCDVECMGCGLLCEIYVEVTSVGMHYEVYR